MRRLKLFGLIALLAVAGRVAQAQTAAGVKTQTVPPVKPQKAKKAKETASPSLASINAELDRLQQQTDDLRRQVVALKAENGRVATKP